MIFFAWIRQDHHIDFASNYFQPTNFRYGSHFINPEASAMLPVTCQ